MFYKVLSSFFSLFSLFNLAFIVEMVLALLLVFIVYLQKNSEEFSSQTKLSAPSSRSDFRIKFTQALIFLFILNTCFLNILYKREYKNFVVSDGKVVVS